MSSRSRRSHYLLIGTLVIFSLPLLFPTGAAIALQIEATITETATPTETSTPLDPPPTETPVEISTETPTPAEPPTGTPVVTETPTETPAPTEAPTETPTPTDTPTPTATSLPSSALAEALMSDALNRLADAYAAGGTDAAGDFAHAQGMSLQQSDANVQISTMLAQGKTIHDARQLVASLGGTVEAGADNLVQISMPIRNLRVLASSGVFAGIRLPSYAQPMIGTEDSEGIAESGATAWHTAGLVGAGVKVAILDVGFKNYNASGTDLPPVAQMHVKSFRADGKWLADAHGTEAAQVVYDMAPGAELWLVAVNTDLEFAEAIDWLIAQNVDIISASIGFPNYDKGDGTGFLVDSVDAANAAGILYVTAAGNGGVGHWQGSYVDDGGTDPSGDFLDWDTSPTTDIYNLINWPDQLTGCRTVQVSLAWNNWNDWDGINKTDYNLQILQSTNGFATYTVVKESANDQFSGYPWPTENMSPCITQTSASQDFAIRIQRIHDTGSATLEMYTNWDLEYDNAEITTGNSSLVVPADAENAFTVGAYNWFSDGREPQSSQGPINGGGDIKPDITGPDCVTTTLHNGSDGSAATGFCGTSAAAPHVAGAAALIWQANPTFTPLNIRTELETAAENDASDPTPGQDNLWGWGILKMGTVPSSGPTACTAGTATCAADPNDAWPLFQNVPTHTGSSTSVVPNPADLQWTSPALGAAARSPVVGPNEVWPSGLVYVVAGRYVYGLDPDRGGQPAQRMSGTELITWKFDLGTAGAAKGQAASAVTDYDGSHMYVYVGSGDGYVYKLDGVDSDWLNYIPDDPATWGQQPVCRSAKLGTDLSKASPTIGADGTIYFVDDAAIDRLIAVNPDCSRKWFINLGAGPGTSSPTYWANPTSDGTEDDLIFVGADKLYAVTIWGGKKGSVNLPGTTVQTTPLIVNVGDDDTPVWRVYVVDPTGDLYRIDPTNPSSATLAGNVASATHYYGSLAAYRYASGIGYQYYYLYWGNGSTLYRHDTNGGTTTPASKGLSGSSLGYSTPVVDGAGNVFIGSGNKKVYGVSGGGVMPALSGWPKTVDGTVYAGLAISPDQRLYVPSSTGKLWAFSASPSCASCDPDSASDWPLFQQNQSHTGESFEALPSTPPLPLLWSRLPGGAAYPPVVGAYGLTNHPQGIAYFVTGRYLRALDLTTRNVLWSYDLGVAGTPAGFAAPAVATRSSAPGFTNNVVFVGGKDGYLHAVDSATGTRIWAVDVGGNISKASPLIDDDGTIYVVEDATSDRLIAVSYTGAVRWTAKIGAAGGTSSPVYDFDNNCVYVGGKKLYGFDATDGTPCLNWDDGTGDGGYALGATTTFVPSAPVIAGGYVYALNNLGDLYRVPLNGAGGKVLAYNAPTGSGAGSLAYNSANGYIYWALYGRVYRHAVAGAMPNGGEIVLQTTRASTANSTPVVDGSGNVFVGTGDGKLWKVTDATATQVYKHPYSLANAGAITHNPKGGVLLWPSVHGELLAFGTSEGLCSTCSANTGYWPLFQKNAAHNPGENYQGGGSSIRQSRQYTGSGATRPPVVDDVSECLPPAPAPPPNDPVGCTDPDRNHIYFVVGSYLVAREMDKDTPVWLTGTTEKKYYLGSLTSAPYVSPALGRDTSRPVGDRNIIFVGTADGYLHAVKASDGSLLWKVDVGSDISRASPVVSDQGYVLVVEDGSSTDQLIAVDFKGSIVWHKPIGNLYGKSSPAINNNGDTNPNNDIVVVGGAGGLYGFNLVDGSPATGWTAANPAPIGITDGAPVVAYQSDGATFDAYYVVNRDGKLWRIAANGDRIDKDGVLSTLPLQDVPGTGGAAAPLVIAHSGHNHIFFGVGNTLYEYSIGGTNSPLALGGDLGSSTPLVGDGTIYIGSSDGKLYVVSGLEDLTSTAWTSTAVGASMAGSGVFLDVDHLVWPAANGKLLVFQDSSGNPAATDSALGQWPLFQGSSEHVGAATAFLSADPAEQWAVPGGGDVRGVVIGEDNQPFYSLTNPTFPDGVVYFIAGRYLNALDVATHLIAKRWDMGASGYTSGYESPAVIRVADPGRPDRDVTRVFVGDKTGVVRSYGTYEDPVGSANYHWGAASIWATDVGADASKASPLAGHNDFVYVLEDAATDRLHAINQWNGAIVWTRTLGAGPGTSSPAYYDGTTDLVLVGANGLYGIDAIDNTMYWSCSLGTGAYAASAPLVINDMVYVLTTNAKLWRIQIAADPTDAPTCTSLGGPTGTVGAASLAAFEYSSGNYYLYFGLGNKLYRYDTDPAELTPLTNIALGTLATNFTNSTPLVDSSGQVFIGGADGRLYGVNGTAATMVKLGDPALDDWNAVNGSGWPKRIGVGTTASSAVGSLAMDSDGYLYVPSLDDNLRRFGPKVPTSCTDCDLYTEAQWPMFQYDRGHTGYDTAGAGHRTPITVWTKNNVPSTPTPVTVVPRTPVLGPATDDYLGGVLYYTGGKYLIARDAQTGAFLWAFDLGAAPTGGASPALLVTDFSSNGCSDETSCSDDAVAVIVGAADGFLYAVNAYPQTNDLENDWLSHDMLWRIDLGLNISKSSPTIGPDGTIYIVEDAAVDVLHAVYWNGVRSWSQPLGAGTGASSPTYYDAATDRIFVGSANKIYAFDAATGASISDWPVTIPVGKVNTTPVINGDDLWVVNNYGDLYRLDPAATTAQTLSEPVYGETVGAVGDGVAPAVQYDPYTEYDIIAVTAGTRLYRVVWNGTAKVGTPRFAPLSGTVGTSSAVIDDNGWTYVLDSVGYLNAFYRYATDGAAPLAVFKKKVATQGTLTGGIIVGNIVDEFNYSYGWLYVPSRNNTLYGLSRR